MKLVAGEVRNRQSGNLGATMWKDKPVVSLLSANTPPEPEIHAVQSVVQGRKKRVVPAESMKKPDVDVVYNSAMNRVSVDDQYRSYYRNFRTFTRTEDYPQWSIFLVRGKKFNRLPTPQNLRKSCYRIIGITTHKLGPMNILWFCLQSRRSIAFSAKNWLLIMQP